MIVGYQIIDGQTGRVVAVAKTLAGACRAVDRRDNAYGAYRYRKKAIYQEPVAGQQQKELAK